MKRGDLKCWVKAVVREELASQGVVGDEDANVTGSVDDGEGEPMLAVNVEDIREVLSHLNSNLNEEETDLLFRLNSDLKEVNGQATVFTDKESNPGVTSYVVDAEDQPYYFRINPNGDHFDIEIIEMQREFLQKEKKDKPFGDWIKSKWGFQNVDYHQLMELLGQYIGAKPLLERFQRMKRVLNDI
jgi:hypothetical protein